MSKKRNKSPAANIASGNKWESNITAAELNEDNWSYSLSMIIENIPQDTETINYINLGISTGLRKKFTLITLEKITQLINDFGNPKSKKGKEAPLNFEICEIGKSHLDKNEALPAPYLAKFIKWIMLTNKTEDMKNTGDTNKKVDGKVSKAKKATDKSERAKSSGGKKGSQVPGKRSPEPPSVKQDNKLRKRGDPDPDIQYIDDEPDDGSSRYFVISGLVDHLLLASLADIGCITTSLVKVTRDIHIPNENLNEEVENQERISNGSDKENSDNNLYEMQIENLKSFWTNINPVLNDNKTLLNTPIITLVAKHLMFPVERENEDLKIKCAMELFESLAVLMYDLLDLKRQWKNYLDKSKLIALPVKTSVAQTHENTTPRESIKEGVQASPDNTDSHMNFTFDKFNIDYYNFLLQDVPIESTSIYLQMSAMLDQVEITAGEKTPIWELNKSDLPKDLNEDSIDVFKKITDNIYLPKESLLELKTSLKIPLDDDDENRNKDQNSPIHVLDSITQRDREINTKNFGKNGALGHELQMLVASFRHFDLLKFIPTDDQISRKRAAKLQELINYLNNTGLSAIEINYAIKLFILENLTLSGVDENGVIRINNEDGYFQRNNYQVWDDPYMILNDVAQSVIDEENKTLKDEAASSEKDSISIIESEPALSFIKTENFTEGILKSSRVSSRSQSPENIKSRRKSSVHFLETERVESPTMSTETQMDIMAFINNQNDEGFQEILLDYLSNLRKRNFSEWCFEEFYEPHVLLQIVHQSIYKLPYIDIYDQRRVDGKLVVLHNPFHPDTKYNHHSWNKWLHSNVGFRNYLDFVHDKITDWNRDQEAIYQANLLNQELQIVETEIKETEVKGKSSKTNEKGKKPKPSKSRSRSTSRGSSAEETSTQELSLIVPGSLKAQKLEQEKINKAKAEEEMKKEQKRQLSAQKKTEKDLAKNVEKTKDSKRPSSKASNKSKTKKTAFEDSGENFDKENYQEIDTDRIDGEEYWPFISYHLDNNLAHFMGMVAHLFPSDGSIIRVFKMQKLLDTTSVRVSVITTQSHVFTIHILDPTYSPDSQIDNFDQILEQFSHSKNICNYGASTCTFNDGITIAASNNGYSGSQLKNKSPIGAPNDEISSHRSNDLTVNGNKEEIFQNDTNETNEKIITQKNPFVNHMDYIDSPNIILTTPDGVQVSVGYESAENENQRNLLLFMCKFESSLKPSVPPELSSIQAPEIGRYITSDGRVVTIFKNELIKVLFPDGTVALSQLSMQSSVSQDGEVEEFKIENINMKESPNSKRKTKQSKSISVEPQTPLNTVPVEDSKPSFNYSRKWTITLSNGEVFETVANLNSIFNPKPLIETIETKLDDEATTDENNDILEANQPTEKERSFKSLQTKERLLTSYATDPSTGETLVTRSDGTLLLVSQDAGIFLCEHSDGTRFTKYFNVEKSSSSTYEPGEISRAKISELLLIESKQYPAVIIDLTNEKIETRCGSMGALLSNSCGHHIFKHSDNTEIEYRPDGEIIFTASVNSQMSYLQPDGPFSYVFNPTSNVICEIIDSEGTEFIVNINGEFDVKINKKNDKPFEEASQVLETDQDLGKLRKLNSVISMTNDSNDNVQKYDQHAPRLFTINPDGSGSELLRYRDIVDTLVNSDIDENYFHCREEIQNSPKIIAHTILHSDSKIKPWKYEYSRKTVLPKGLTCRDMKTFPPKEIKTDGPPFGMSVGKGLEIYSNPIMAKNVQKPKKSFRQDHWLNPMQFRQFYHYPTIGKDVRSSFSEKLIDYNKKILQQRQLYKDLEIVNQSDEEKKIADEILEKFKVLKFSKESIANAIGSLVNINSTQGEMSSKAFETNAKTALPKNPSHRKLDVILEQEKINKEKEIENRASLKNHIVPKYFTSIYGKDFISKQAMDLQSLNKSMKLFPISREGTDVNDLKEKNEFLNETETSEVSLLSPKFQVDYLEQSPENSTKNSKNLLKPKLIIQKRATNYLYYDSNLFIPNEPKRLPELSNINLPNYLYAERPSIEPNIHQALVEDPVRRKVYTTSLIGGSETSQILQRKTRGLNVFPARVDTGLLKEGLNYTFKIKLINTGPESSCFKIKQPHSSTGIWVEFLPGPIAAGLSRKLNIHIYAIANNLEKNSSNVSLLEHFLQITTNTDQLIIPIVGRVMTAENYQSIYPISKTDSRSEMSELESRFHYYFIDNFGCRKIKI